MKNNYNQILRFLKIKEIDKFKLFYSDKYAKMILNLEFEKSINSNTVKEEYKKFIFDTFSKHISSIFIESLKFLKTLLSQKYMSQEIYEILKNKILKDSFIGCDGIYVKVSINIGGKIFDIGNVNTDRLISKNSISIIDIVDLLHSQSSIVPKNPSNSRSNKH